MLNGKAHVATCSRTFLTFERKFFKTKKTCFYFSFPFGRRFLFTKTRNEIQTSGQRSSYLVILLLLPLTSPNFVFCFGIPHKKKKKKTLIRPELGRRTFLLVWPFSFQWDKLFLLVFAQSEYKKQTFPKKVCVRGPAHSRSR